MSPKLHEASYAGVAYNLPVRNVVVAAVELFDGSDAVEGRCGSRELRRGQPVGSGPFGEDLNKKINKMIH